MLHTLFCLKNENYGNNGQSSSNPPTSRHGTSRHLMLPKTWRKNSTKC